MTDPSRLADFRELAWSILHDAGLRPEPGRVPPELARAASADGRTRLTAERWRLSAGECRWVFIGGGSAEVVNAWCLPARPTDTPVFAAEVLAFGRKPRLAFLDLPTPGVTGPALSVARAAARAARQACSLPARLEVPAWAVADGSGWHLFTRTTDPAHLPAIRGAFAAYLTAWAGLARPDGPARSGLADYLRNHAASTPGRPFLGRAFGANWANRFLDDFLYAPPNWLDVRHGQDYE